MDRREFLKISGAAVLSALASRIPVKAEEIVYHESPAPASLGRNASWHWQAVRTQPEVREEVVEWKKRNDIFPILAKVEGGESWSGNPIWYKTPGGYIHSSYVQPVENQPQTKFLSRIIQPGLWAQVCVPVTGARWTPNSAWVMRNLYYENVFRIVNIQQDSENRVWYQLEEGISKTGPGPYALASDLRMIPRRELKPISPEVKDKWIRIRRKEQDLTCYEGEDVVFVTRVATGLRDTPTPRGEHKVLFKRHTRRMEGNINGDEYDLTGIPFPVYFTWSGVAIHGTYWHNDFGTPHSHGCVNVTATAAKWIFRWVTPQIEYRDYMIFSDKDNPGTRVVVV